MNPKYNHSGPYKREAKYLESVVGDVGTEAGGERQGDLKMLCCGFEDT